MTYPPVQIVLSQVVEEEVARGEQINLRVIAGESSMFFEIQPGSTGTGTPNVFPADVYVV